jgi:thioredoxin
MLKISTTETFTEGVIDASLNKLVVVDFWATWCGPCRMLKPVLERVSSEEGVADLVDFVLVDVETNKELADLYQVSGTPTIIFFKEGIEVGRNVGAMTKPQFLEAMSAHLD